MYIYHDIAYFHPLFVLHSANKGYVSYPYSKGHHFTRFQAMMTWSEARALCQSVGGDLAVLNEEIKNEFVFTNFPKKQLWIGATDAVEEGNWTWVNGQKMQPEVYTNWGRGEPNRGKEENCLFMKRGTWHDNDCMAQLNPLCEHPSWPKCSILN